MTRCQSPTHAPFRGRLAHPDAESEDLRQINALTCGWGDSHSGYDSTPLWYCAKCRRTNLGRWKYHIHPKETEE